MSRSDELFLRARRIIPGGVHSPVRSFQNVDGTPLTDLAGYRIYYGTVSRTYSDMVEVTDPQTTSHTLDLTSGDYYVAMTALDLEGNESAYSNEVLKTSP